MSEIRTPPHTRIEASRVAAEWLDVLETLRERFWEYREGWLSEKDFKRAVTRYSQTLQEMRKLAPDPALVSSNEDD